MYDVIVVGARCAGSPTAMLLARRGYRVLVVDKATFPSDTISSHFLHQSGVSTLKRWRLLDRVAATNAPGVTKMSFDAGPVRLVGSAPPYEDVPQGYCVRRKVLDKILVDAAVEAGAEVREGFTVTEITRDEHDRVIGIRGHAFGGKTVTEQARLVIGADGVRSRCRELLVGLAAPKFSGNVAYRALFPTSLVAGMDLVDYEKWWGPRQWVFLSYFIRQHRDDYFIVAVAPQAEWPHETSSVPSSREEMRTAFAGFHPNVQRQIAVIPSATKWAVYDAEPLEVWSRGRVALLGDACHSMTPYMGQGAAMAIEDGAMLTRCLDASKGDVGYALQLYEANRKNRTIAMQRTSRANTWLKSDADPDWVFGYDVFEHEIVPPARKSA